jgi:glycosidase
VKIKSLSEIDLSTSLLSKVYNANRTWEGEIIYFLLIDRFHTGENNIVKEYQPHYHNNQEQDFTRLLERQGGTFRGIQSQLSYIKKLGCTAIWLSPVFENYENSYHGYAIADFLAPDPRFGSMDELKALVKEAHQQGLRIILDVVINHTADTWYYKEGAPSYNGSAFTFDGWKDENFPNPKELRNPAYYKKFGAIRHWDSYPETQEGDIFELKKLTTDESPIGKEVLSALIKIYCYWIKETDVDGFRLDTVKHLTPSAVALFCSAIREYTHYLGKDHFLLLGEAVGDDRLMRKYFKYVKTTDGYKKGLDALLDFPLHFVLEEVVKGDRPVNDLYKVYRTKEKLLAKVNKSWHDLVVFLDNHDQIGQEYKSRITSAADEPEVLAMVGWMYFLYGIPCIYYGTEQFLKGAGNHDVWLREPMFNKSENSSYLNADSFLYREISKLSILRSSLVKFISARMEIDYVSVNSNEFISCEYQNNVIYWSKRIVEEKLILLYNPKKTEKIVVCVKLTSMNLRIKSKFEYVYGKVGEIMVECKDDCGYLNIDLNPQQFVILK